MESDLQAPSSNGLTRYRSAPSSYFTDIIDREFYEHIFNRPSSPETERVFSRFMNSLRDDAAPEDDSLHLDSSSVKEEHDITPSQPLLFQHHHHQQQQNNVNSFNYQSTSRPPLPNQNQNLASSGGVEGVYSNNNNNNNRLPQTKNQSNLVRHSSSPAGLFSQIHIENGYVVDMRGMGTLGAVNKSVEEVKFSSSRTRRLKNPQNYSSSASGRMSSIAEIGNRDSREDNPDAEAFGETQGEDFITELAPWDDSVAVNDIVAGLKRFRDDDVKPFSSGLNAAETQNESRGQQAAPLAHQMSLPNTSAEMAAIEKFLQFSDSVPCKIRAKRGCATHPRSIAERVRRTKISERMRKLQDLVPNMDKQTNTADMLDLAVDYIKDLQKQVETLSDCQAKCTCSSKPQQ
ncbi:hypothetical protein HN51_042777 [Arachis hypogaea]|uniref:BHLH domain-containing protein n=1 Tax=Arachis hypogaea TaxID=3818 RepID=A0A444Y8M9_ARAHY|nr:Transcription factor [Arachis hypogaea]RYQ98207.1 hypothetical protein Ahy_B08g094267 isoform B [Arachis hypogaea]